LGNSSINIVDLSAATATEGLGDLRYTGQGELQFTPAAAGTYQLRTSTNLGTYANQGTPINPCRRGGAELEHGDSRLVGRTLLPGRKTMMPGGQGRTDRPE